MPNPIKFLNYTGPVNHKIIDHLLRDLKNSKDYLHLNKTTAKRVYAIIVEILENIAKHSIKKIISEIKTEPFILAEKSGNKIIIKAGNPVSDDIREKLKAIIELVNYIDNHELTGLYEDKISRKSKLNGNGAGLGFILMRLKSGNKIDYSFCPINENILVFKIQITVNKYIMRKLFIERTVSSPKVVLDPENNFFEISGESRPPDVNLFYNEIISWLDDYSLYLFKSNQGGDTPVFNFDFEYFNSSSAKYILDFCKLLSSVHLKGRDVMVKWHYEDDDIDMLESGREMSRISKMPFEYIKKDKE
jgi:hypothetical protein